MDYRPARRGLVRYLTGSSELAAAVRQTAEDVAARAKALANAEAHDTGDYANSIRVEPDPGPDRLGFKVVANVPYAAAIEFGNARSRERGILRRAAEATD